MQGYYIPQRSSTHRVYSGARQACRGELFLEQRSSVLPLVESSLSDHLHPPLSVPSVPKRETRHSHVQYLLVQGVVEPVKDLVSAGFYSLLFLIHKDADEFRPVIDLFCLNRFLDIPTFRMKTAERITACFRPNFCITALDLEKAYFDFPVQPDYWKYLLFQTEELFQVCARPLSIYPALWLLAIQHGVGRSQEDRTLLVIQLFLYPDDWLIQASTEDLCAQDTDGVVQLGLLSNHMKSALVANQECVFLMYVFRLTTLLGFLPQKRREPY